MNTVKSRAEWGATEVVQLQGFDRFMARSDKKSPEIAGPHVANEHPHNIQPIKEVK